MRSTWLLPLGLSARDSRKAAVPDLAMVPRFSLMAVAFIPMPVSAMRRRRFSGSTTIEISYGVASCDSSDWMERERKRRLSRASAALEMSSLKKTSRSLYRECTRMSRSRFVFASNTCVSASAPI